MKKNNLKSELIIGPVENKLLMQESPLESIAKVIDYYFPFFIKNILDIADEQTRGLLDIKEIETNKEQIQKNLVDYFWTAAKNGNIFDLMFFQDYILYIKFFLQYPIVTGQYLDINMK